MRPKFDVGDWVVVKTLIGGFTRYHDAKPGRVYLVTDVWPGKYVSTAHIKDPTATRSQPANYRDLVKV